MEGVGGDVKGVKQLKNKTKGALQAERFIPVGGGGGTEVFRFFFFFTQYLNSSRALSNREQGLFHLGYCENGSLVPHCFPHASRVDKRQIN